MKRINQVSPWEGKLVWVGVTKSGTARNGKEWKAVDFTLEYLDAQSEKREITFSVNGVEKVDEFLKVPIGTMLRVSWFPEARYSVNRWWPKLSAYKFKVIGDEENGEGNGFPF